MRIIFGETQNQKKHIDGLNTGDLIKLKFFICRLILMCACRRWTSCVHFPRISWHHSSRRAQGSVNPHDPYLAAVFGNAILNHVTKITGAHYYWWFYPEIANHQGLFLTTIYSCIVHSSCDFQYLLVIVIKFTCTPEGKSWYQHIL